MGQTKNAKFVCWIIAINNGNWGVGWTAEESKGNVRNMLYLFMGCLYKWEGKRGLGGQGGIGSGGRTQGLDMYSMYTVRQSVAVTCGRR